MKKKDWALVIVIATFAAVISLVISKIFFTSSGQRNLQAEVVQEISTEFQQPDPDVFNDRAINPTQLIQIGDNANTQPF